MKARATLAVLAILLLTGCEGFKSKPAVQMKLNDNYATSALLALKAIERDPYVPEKSSGLVSRFTQEKIDAADVSAVSPEERNLTDELNIVYAAQLRLNLYKHEYDRGNAELMALGLTTPFPYTQKQWNAIVKAHSNLALLQIKKINDLKEPLTACFADFEASLRSRLTAMPISCSTLPKATP